MAALTNAVFLLVAMGAIIVESIGRFSHPEPVQGGIVMLVATVGILVNAGTAVLFHKGQGHDLNIRGAFLHMVADAGVSLGVVIAGGVTMATHWEWLDPAVSILVALVVLVGTWGLLRDAVNLAMAAVPKAIDTEAVRACINDFPSVMSCHDLHIWRCPRLTCAHRPRHARHRRGQRPIPRKTWRAPAGELRHRPRHHSSRIRRLPAAKV